MRKALIPAFAVAVATLPAQAQHACPQDLEGWRQLLGAEWIDCHALADLSTTNNPFTDPQSLTGMGFPPPGSGTLNSKYTAPTSPPVSGIQIDGYFPDACDAFQQEPALTAKDGTPFIRGCTPPPTSGQTCVADCHHDAQFVIRILLSSTPPHFHSPAPPHPHSPTLPLIRSSTPPPLDLPSCRVATLPSIRRPG